MSALSKFQELLVHVTNHGRSLGEGIDQLEAEAAGRAADMPIDLALDLYEKASIRRREAIQRALRLAREVGRNCKKMEG